MNQLAVRKAVSFAIDRTRCQPGRIRARAGGDERERHRAAELQPLEAPAVTGETLSTHANAKAADAVLKEAGYTLKGEWAH